MADEKPEKADEVTPKGTVEVDETDLDEVAGGVEPRPNIYKKFVVQGHEDPPPPKP